MHTRIFPLLFLLSIVYFLPSFSFALVRPIAFPVQGEYSFADDYAALRGNGSRHHLGNDIIAAKHTPVVSTVDGVITFIARPQASWGYAITVRDADGYKYHYIHLNNDTPGTDDGIGGEQHAYAPGLSRGSKVVRGQLLGWLGDSGNAENTVPHLHFEIEAPTGEYPNPYESLMAASGGNNRGVVTAVTHGAAPTLSQEEKYLATRLLREGMRDPDVATLHTQLRTLSFFTGTSSEVYTWHTREAVRAFQVREKLEATGAADEITRARILLRVQNAAMATVTSSVTTRSLSFGSRGSDVTAVQQKLKDLGYFSGTPTGYFGLVTQKAVLAFQKAKGIEQLGIVGPRTRAALTSL